MASPDFTNIHKRASTVSSAANSVNSVSRTAATFTEELLNRDPPPGFLAATAQATSKAPTLGDIRRGSFGQDGWASGGTGGGSGSARPYRWSGASQGRAEPAGANGEVGHGLFAPLTEESAKTDLGLQLGEQHQTRGINGEGAQEQSEKMRLQVGEVTDDTVSYSAMESERMSDKKIIGINRSSRAYSSGYVPPPKVPWTTSTRIALTAFGRWAITPFGFFVTLYGLNVVAWGGMLFLLLCNASPAMCWAPIPTPANRRHVSPAAALGFPGPYYFNCNDINSPRRIWIEIDSQILNAFFCVTGFGLVPWRFRDLYYLLRWRLTSEKKHGSEKKIYGLRVLAGFYRGWFRLPGSETLDELSTQQYLSALGKNDSSVILQQEDLEASALTVLEHDPRVPLPLTKKPADPASSIRAEPTQLWKVDFFVWCQVWNTFFQCCLCGFMWGENRYQRPPWSTGMFVGLACIIVAVGGIVAFKEGRKVKKVEGVAPPNSEANVSDHGPDDGYGLEAISSGASRHETVLSTKDLQR